MTSSKKAIKKKPQGKAKRKLSPYILFSMEKRDSVIKEFGFEKRQIGEIGKKLGEMWKATSDSEKEQYKAKAAAL